MTELVTSRYAIISNNTYRRGEGPPFRYVYAARQARLIKVDPVTADAVREGALANLPAATLERLAELDIVADRSGAPGDSELEAVLDQYRIGSTSADQRRFTIMPTSYCNMGCSYCGQEHTKSRVSEARMERLAQRVEGAIAAGDTKSVSVTWFGGEPMMGYRLILELSDRFVAAAQRHGVDYHARMATNGSLISLRKLVELHDRCLLRDVDITLDGPAAIHDRRRVLKGGGRSFDRCVGVLSELARSDLAPNLKVGLRVNVDRENEEHVETLLETLASAGLNRRRFRVQFMPVHSWGNDVSDVELEGSRFAALELGWLERAEHLGFDAPVLPGGTKRTTCMATNRSGEIHDPAGRVYSCSEYPLVPGVRDTKVIATLESLVGSEQRPAGPFDDWYDDISTDRGPQTCGQCALLPVCGGSCPKLWREGHRPCPSVRYNLQERFDAIARRAGCAVVEGVS